MNVKSKDEVIRSLMAELEFAYQGLGYMPLDNRARVAYEEAARVIGEVTPWPEGVVCGPRAYPRPK